MTSPRVRSGVGAAALLVLAACGGGTFGGRGAGAGGAATARARPTLATHPAPTALLRVHGAGALALPRAVEGAVHLALFVDAGWRDATPPQLATATARLAAARSSGVVARVEPDLTEWTVACTRARLDACIARLASVLALRESIAEEEVAARRAVVDARLLALADEGRTADSLAFAALWAQPEAGAFGAVENDGDVDGATIAGFAAAHYGPSRALFVAAGDVDATVLRDALERALAAAPEATATRRAAVQLPPGDVPAVRVRVGETDAVSVVLHVHDAGLARAIAARARASEPDDPEQPTAFALRDGGAVHGRRTVRRGGADVLARQAAATVARLETARREVTRTSAAARPDALDALARAHGRAFATGDAWPDAGDDAPGTRPPDAAMRLGVGVVVRGARRRPLRGPDPDATLGRETETRVRDAVSAVERALAEADEVSGGEATLANGARLATQRMPGAAARALAVRFAADHGAEPAAWHGRAALAAEALGVACRERAAQAGVTVQPRATRGSFGLLATGPSDDALLVLLDCVLHASPDESAIDEARRRRIDALSPVSAPELHTRALAARALTPSTPALLAPAGSAEGVAAAPAAELHALLDAARRGARTRVVWAGDGEAPARAIARRLAVLEPGSVDTATVPGAASVDPVLAATWRGGGLRAVVALRAVTADTNATPAHAEGTARAFAHALAAQLGEAPGLRAVTADGAALAAHDVGVWVALDLDETALEALPATMEHALTALTTTSAGRAAVTAAEAWLADSHAFALAVPAEVADRHAEALVAGLDPTPARTAGPPPSRVVDALAAAPWRVVVARPSRPAR